MTLYWGEFKCGELKRAYMNRQKLVLLCNILALNLILITGALFSESPLTLAVVFTLDALIGIARILYERLAAGSPPDDEPPAMTPLRFLEPLYDVVINKRGNFRILN